ncbi:MAG: transposase [bacterium]|uniref:Chromosomal replication initiator DnaA domain protein n=2 Tax=Bacteria candidate phyla TaxID=1783234 RepID=A0A117M681_UNCT6|nr:MAG: Chromosomal replication initiator DnaA domain protein [candidate division TA06 bacterium 32_111]KUK86589.1 MAG: Chromosomal replication initiator DnaA domain protein [candidate division TA06 bacterium 34_109]MDI6701249.1 transposase [bacterium]HAF07872.1 hypothetical protein [candidate division WOR-3 bacterium]HCP17390.1 hypothetical protein [candidate division WOR-3 bacterium]
MRRARIKYEGSYHHVMNRGFENEKIFVDSKSKNYFINLIEEFSKKFKMSVYAYCIMNNHFHIILKNDSNKLSEFMKNLDSSYGIYYRKRFGGRGYVFASRFKSTLIENDRYLKMSIIYTLLNPVKAGLTKNPFKFKWSSINNYFNSEKTFVATEKVEEIFESRKNLEISLKEWKKKKLPVKNSRVGEFLGSEQFYNESLKYFDRRKRKKTISNIRIKKERKIDLKKFIKQFEKSKKISFKDADFGKIKWKRLRSELLVFLHDKYNLTYRQIGTLEYFKNLQVSSFGKIYRRWKEKNVTLSSTVPN